MLVLINFNVGVKNVVVNLSAEGFLHQCRYIHPEFSPTSIDRVRASTLDQSSCYHSVWGLVVDV